MNLKSRVVLLTAVVGLLSTGCLASFPYDLGGDYEPPTYPEQRYDSSDRLVQYAGDLTDRADEMSGAIAEQVVDQDEYWTEADLEALYGAEKFLASCQVFLRLAEQRSEDVRRSRSGMEEAFNLLAREFDDFETVARRAGIRSSDLSECANLLKRMEREVGARRGYSENVVERDELANRAWDGKYAKGPDAAVFLIVRQGNRFVRRPFKSLESLFKYNYDVDRGENPWANVADVPAETLDRMEIGEEIDRTFEGQMIIEPAGTRQNRPVYLIQGGKKRGLSEASLVTRYGGWKKVREVPKEIINSYPEGDPIR